MRNLITSIVLLFLFYECSQNRSPSNDPVQVRISSKDLKLRLDSFYEMKMFKEALIIIDTLIVDDSLNGELYYKKGICLDIDVPRDSTIIYFFKAAQLGYRISDCYYLIGLSYYIDKKDSLSLLYMNKALEINPRDKEAEKVILELTNKKNENNKRSIKAI